MRSKVALAKRLDHETDQQLMWRALDLIDAATYLSPFASFSSNRTMWLSSLWLLLFLEEHGKLLHLFQDSVGRYFLHLFANVIGHWNNVVEVLDVHVIYAS